MPTGDGHVATPDKASEQANVTTTSVLFQPLAFGAGADVAVTVGAVLSIDTDVLADAEFPKLSVAVPETGWLTPSVDTTTDAGHEATPETASEQVNETVTSLLFQPFEFGAGPATAVIDGP